MMYKHELKMTGNQQQQMARLQVGMALSVSVLPPQLSPPMPSTDYSWSPAISGPCLVDIVMRGVARRFQK